VQRGGRDKAADQRGKTMNRAYVLVAGSIATAGLAIGSWAVLTQRGNDPFADCRTSAVAGAGRIGGPFSLIDQRGMRVSETEVIRGLTLFYFGYAYCPDVCPLDLSRNAEVTDLVKAKGIALQPVFVTIDPERDEIAAVAGAYGVFYARNGEGDGYLMSHSTHSYLMHPAHGFMDFFDRSLRADDVAERIACFAGKL
jgi:protein SCO1